MNYLDHIMNKLFEMGVDIAPKILLFLVIIIVGKYLTKFFVAGLKKFLTKGKVDPTLISFGSNFLYFGLMAMVLLVGISNLGVNTNSLFALLGAAGIAIGLAFQNMLSNIFSGIIVVTFRPFAVGDQVEIGDSRGFVEEIGVLSTQIRTADNKIIFVPNGKLTSEKLANYSVKETRMITITLLLDYQNKLEDVKQILRDILQKESKIMNDPIPQILVNNFTEKGMEILIRPWVKNGDYAEVFHEILEHIKIAFDDKGIIFATTG